jgi:hypothetical protein
MRREMVVGNLQARYANLKRPKKRLHTDTETRATRWDTFTLRS